MADRVSRRGKSSLAGVADRVIAGVAGMVELEDISMVVLEFAEAIVTTVKDVFNHQCLERYRSYNNYMGGFGINLHKVPRPPPI